ncbi:peroxisomal N(1)-acetyl-spermine/spermidine oxidase [Plutella xylostella]|uniref:peroxisomal N(1)-acetyl-spermine/spermidine oxidase n=1 Tax=Plutella xylostella TaxID=51655 RepID=UPI002032D9C7|nr:peroxisomal N(1)-acetyl-spermine/spermidine oxidase [Plutella xylostella]
MINFSKLRLAAFARTCRLLQTRWGSQLVECGPDLSEQGICAVDPCDPSQCFDQPRVVIIGAGMAGLSAAARLATKGITDFTVLEANERPGGRIHSCWLGDVVAELGAHWNSDSVTSNPIMSLKAYEDPPRPGVPAAEHPRGLMDRVVAGKMEFPTTITAYHKFRQIEKEAAHLYALGGSKQHGSMLNFMSIRIQQELHQYPEEQQHDAARVMFGLVHMLQAKCAGDAALLCADHGGCFMRLPGGDVRVPLGLVGALAPLLRQIPDGCIEYCKPVNCVYWGTSPKTGYRAVVQTTDGSEYPADYVIVTVSLGVLSQCHDRMFCPALPGAKLDAIRCLGFGACNKIFMEYCHPFYYWHKGDLNTLNVGGTSFAGLCGWLQGLGRIEVVPHSKHVLCAYLSGDGAVSMESLCDMDVAEGITDVLRKLTANPNIPYPKMMLRSHWCTDPYFAGAYSYDVSNSGGQAQRALACPLPGGSDPVPPVLLFAGEATVPGHYATVGGARLSGIREAERIVELTVRLKGPPLPTDKPKETKVEAQAK